MDIGLIHFDASNRAATMNVNVSAPEPIDLETLTFPNQCYTGMSLDPYVLKDIVRLLEDGVKDIVEFGSGASTEFLLNLRAD